MWIVLGILAVVLGTAGVAWRLLVIGRRAPDENDRSRQHEVPGADGPPPPGPRTSPKDHPMVD
jgi:hypothetical protein